MYVPLKPKFHTDISNETKKKISKSEAEIENLKFRAINCPYCGTFLFEVFEDIKGHIAVKCQKCKGVVPINPAYFRRSDAIGRWRKKYSKK